MSAGSARPDRLMALAGLYQSTVLVQQVARTGTIDGPPFETSISSLFHLEAERTDVIFGGWTHLAPGLQTVCRQLGGARDVELSRYAVCLLFLERKLGRRRDLMDKIVEGIERARSQVDYFSPTHESVLANLADLYASTISTLAPRIMVTGTPAYLSNRDNANRIRALLLAGLRAAVLWRQLGGSRWQLLLSRSAIARAARAKLAEVESERAVGAIES